ncbi:MAG: hypothetical protein L0Z54_02555 [Thermoplasmata archaeon]|nr:hypothetical protein [Thermoplasmata archaeon]
MTGGFDITSCPMPERPFKQRVSIYIGHHGGEWSEWYVGMSDDPRRALFVEHNVNRRKGEYRHFTALDPALARKIKSYYMRKGMSNGVQAPDDCRVLYFYRMTEDTVQ